MVTKSKEKSQFGRMRVFILESISPLDLLENRHESSSLTEVCKMIGHEVAPIRVNSKSEFRSACKYIATIDSYEDDSNETTLCLHLSAHGNDNGLSFGRDKVGWDELFKIVKPIFTNEYRGSKILNLSCCHASNQMLTKDFKQAVKEDDQVSPPKYMFSTYDDEVLWSDAIVGWTILYHLLPSIDFADKNKVIDLFKKIRELGVGRFVYYRWDEGSRSYRSYIADKIKRQAASRKK